MTIAQVSVTLSRAHKIAERLKAGAAERFTVAENGMGVQTAFSSMLPSLVPAMMASVQRAQTALGEARAWQAAYAEVRKAIGRANHEAGVSELLADQERINRELGWHQTLVAGYGLSAPHLDVVLAPTSAAPAGVDRHLSFNVLSTEQLDALKATVARLRRESFALSDKVAEANATRVTLAIPADIAEQVSA